MTSEITILSAGAVAPGITKVAEAFRGETRGAVKISFATAPAILKRIDGGELVDIVIAPPSVLDELANTWKASAVTRVAVGRIGVGVMVRDGAPLPKITTVEEFTQSLRSAESLVYNQASTGIYLDALFELHGHIRATNPLNDVMLRSAAELVPDDYSSHLVVLGGVDWNTATKDFDTS